MTPVSLMSMDTPGPRSDHLRLRRRAGDPPKHPAWTGPADKSEPLIPVQRPGQGAHKRRIPESNFHLTLRNSIVTAPLFTVCGWSYRSTITLMTTIRRRLLQAWQFTIGSTVRKSVTFTVAAAVALTTLLVNWQILSPEKKKPDQSIVIDSPNDGSTIRRCLEFVSGHGIIPRGYHLWVAVIPGSSAEQNKRFTLVGKGEAVQTSAKGQGKWKVVQVNVGAETRVNYHYRLIAILLSDDVNKVVSGSAVNITDFAPKNPPIPGHDRWRIEYSYLPGKRSDPVEVVRNGSKEKACYTAS